jgi:hypothetical protein
MLSSGAGHVPALSGPLSTVPSFQRSGCPPLPPARGDELEAVSFHHRTSVGASGAQDPSGVPMERNCEDRTGSAVRCTSTNQLGHVTDEVFGTHAVSPTGVPSGIWRRTPGACRSTIAR